MRLETGLAYRIQHKGVNMWHSSQDLHMSHPIFPWSKSEQNVTFSAVFSTPSDKNWKIHVTLHREKAILQRLANLHIQAILQYSQSQCTMLELCVTSTFWVIMVFCIFMGRSTYRVLKHDVGVKWDPRRTAAYVPSHFMVLNPIFCYVSPVKLWFFMMWNFCLKL